MPNEIEVGVNVTDQVHMRGLLADAQRQAAAGRTTGMETAHITDTIEETITAARNASGDFGTFDTQGNLRHVHKRTAATVRWQRMSDTFLSSMQTVVGRPISTPSVQPAGQRFTFTDAVLAGSKVAQAGAHVFSLPEDEAIALPGGEVGFRSVRTGLEAIRPSDFAFVADGEDAPETALPLLWADTNKEGMRSFAARHRLTRAAQRDMSAGRLSALAGWALASGIAGLVDHILLQNLVDADPAAFSLGAVAEKGLALGEVAAVVGTNGDAAEVDPNGILRVHGVPAVLTDQIAETVIWAPALTGVALAPEWGLVAERLNRQSDLVLTAFVNAEHLVLDRAAVWIAA